MVLNIITAGIAVLFLIVCVICVMSENSPSEKAASRNFFRRVRITLREINLPVFLLISALVIIAALKTDLLRVPVALVSAGLFAAGLFILNSFRILCGLRSRKKKKSLSPLGWILPSKESKLTPEAGYLKEASETPISSELSERTSL